MARADFEHRYDGKAALEELLGVAGSALSVEQVVESMRQGVSEGKTPGEVIPTFFEGEPRFPSPEVARLLFQNLLGLWDLVASGRPFSLERPLSPRPKKPKPSPPPPFGPEGPDEDFVEAAWRYLEEAERDRARLSDRFENVQDALVAWLDEQGLSDEGYACARLLLLELFSMIELGWPPGTSSAALPGTESSSGAAEPPAALMAYADEAVFEAEQDEESPLSAGEAQRVRDIVKRGLGALWNARRPA